MTGKRFVVVDRSSTIHHWNGLVVSLETSGYPLVWCGVILPPMHRHRCTQYNNTLTRVWHKAYEDGMKTV